MPGEGNAYAAQMRKFLVLLAGFLEMKISGRTIDRNCGTYERTVVMVSSELRSISELSTEGWEDGMVKRSIV